MFPGPLGAGTPRLLVRGLPATAPVLGTALKLPFSTVAIDSGNYWDAVNSRWLPLIPGWYWCEVSTTFTTTASAVGCTFSVQLRKNGVTQNVNNSNMENTAALSSYGLNVGCMINFNGSTDYLEGFGFFNSAPAGVTGQTFGTATTSNYLTAFFLGGSP